MVIRAAARLAAVALIGLLSFSVPQRAYAQDANGINKYDTGKDGQTSAKNKSEGILTRLNNATGAIFDDYNNFYSLRNVIPLCAGIGASAILANTSADKDIHKWYQDDIRSEGTDDFAKAARTFGYFKVQFPAYAGALLLGEMKKGNKFNSTLENWAQKSLRAYIVGGPDVLFLQHAIGSGRPVEGGSGWRPFNDKNGVSGEAFAGAVPFVAAAKMTDNPFLKAIFYGTSTLAGFARVNNDRHYFSQAALGWWISYLSASSVDETDKINVSATLEGIKVAIKF